MAGNVLEVTSGNFNAEVLKSDRPVIVDFWATWCMPCKMLAPVIDEVAREGNDRYKVAKLNIDDAMEVATRFGVMNIPTLMFFDKGGEVGRMVGAASKRDIVKKIEEVFG
ncbi:MAG: thioredoxin [Candidatus Omnitrophota bacterium]